MGVENEKGELVLISKPQELSIRERNDKGEYLAVRTFSFDYAFPVGITKVMPVFSYDCESWKKCDSSFFLLQPTRILQPQKFQTILRRL